MEGRASLAHTDISLGQFVKVGNQYKLNDFNRARFIRWNNETHTACPYWVGSNPGRFRSPEEYRYDPQSEKVDVYSLGNIFYTLLMEESPFHDVSSKQAKHIVKHGGRPELSDTIVNSTDASIGAMVEAMELCHVRYPESRATARQVATLLQSKLEQIDPGRLRQWGVNV
jgi:serine/threonine protein kinase